MTNRIAALPGIDLEPVPAIQYFREVPVAATVRFKQIVVTGPPGAGKSSFIQAIGGWPQEGYLDLSHPGWWRSPSLALRPREVHLGLPFIGQPEALSLFDREWLVHWQRLRLDPVRISLPPEKRHRLAIDWYRRFVFEFMLPPAEVICDHRNARAFRGAHPWDRCINPAQTQAQVEIFGQVFQRFAHQGFDCYVREDISQPPWRLATRDESP